MSSNIQMDKIRVLAACNAYIENSDRIIKKVQEQEIIKRMKPVTVWGLTMFGKSRAKATAELENDLWSEYHMVKFRGYTFVDRVKNIKVACELSLADHVFVDVQDVRMLQKFFK